MDANRESNRPDDDQTLARLADAVAGMSSDELRGLVGRLLDTGKVPGDLVGPGPFGPDPFAPVPVPSRRRPPRPEVATYRIRLDLADAAPPIWRRLEVASDLRLDALHTVVQAAMGWTDSHLHQFSVGDSRADRWAERYLTEFDLSEGDTGVAERDVRLDEVLQEPGDVLRYTYDFGDGWDHTLRLEKVLPRAADARPARCTGGRRACPPEDCGGSYGYAELIADAEALARGEDPLDDEAAERLGWYYPGLTPEQVAQAAARFEVEEADAALAPAAVAADGGLSAVVGLPDQVGELLDRATGQGRAVLLSLIARARLDAPVVVDAEVAARMVAPFAWLIRHVGAAGVQLTSAGYLRPADVTAVARAFGIDAEWVGTMNREVHTYPVLALREAVQAMGLLRVSRGRLHATRAAIGLAEDPVGLWWHLAERLPAGRARHQRDAGLITLLAVAAETPEDDGGPPDGGMLAVAMASVGWVRSDGGRITAGDVAGNTGHTVQVLSRLGAYRREGRRGRSDRATAEGIAFARAALRSWP